MNDELLETFYRLLNRPSGSRLQQIRMLFLIVHAMKSEGTTNIRSLYYQYPDLFPKAEIAHRTVKILSLKSGLHVEAFKLQATSKGLYYFNNEQYLIEDGITLDAKPEFLIIVEKDTIFQELAKYLDSNIGMLTGKGFPDQKTLKFVETNFSNTKACGLCDCNIYGHHILKQYCMRLTNFHCIGLFEGNEGGQPNVARINRLQAELNKMGEHEWSKDLDRMKTSRVGEIDDLIREHGAEWLYEQILQQM